jgi:hypothetical protein
MESPWNSLEVAKLVVSVLTPLTVFFLGAWISRRLKTIELARLKESEERQQELEERKREIERVYTPHLEFRIDCQFFGPKQRQFLATFVLIANNRGRVVHRFPSIRLRVRGLRKNEPFQYWAGREPRAEFPHKIFEAEVVPRDWNFIYVEPGVAHQITFTSVIPADYSFLIANAEFNIDKFTPHNVEGVFPVPEDSA